MSPSRSTNVTIINKLSSDLVLDSASVSHGEWSQGLKPVQLISANSNGNFQAESAGVMTGDQGAFSYSNPSVGTFNFTFNNPYSGSNGYSESAPSGYIAIRSGGSGDNAEVTWTLQKIN
ncbi:crystal protein ET79 [Trichoderma chlorosporum]